MTDTKKAQDPNQDELQFLEELRKRYQSDLRYSELQAANYGMAVPLSVSNEIQFAKTKIKEIEKQIEETRQKLAGYSRAAEEVTIPTAQQVLAEPEQIAMLDLKRKLYFPEIAGRGWVIVVRIINPTKESANLVVTLRSRIGMEVKKWHLNLPPRSGFDLSPSDFSLEPIPQEGGSLEIASDQPLVTEKHQHDENLTSSIAILGMEPSTRAIFCQVAPGWRNWISILNVSDEASLVRVVLFDLEGQVLSEWGMRVESLNRVDLTNALFGQHEGYLFIESTQPFVSERHMHHDRTGEFALPAWAFGQ